MSSPGRITFLLFSSCRWKLISSSWCFSNCSHNIHKAGCWIYLYNVLHHQEPLSQCCHLYSFLRDRLARHSDTLDPEKNANVSVRKRVFPLGCGFFLLKIMRGKRPHWLQRKNVYSPPSICCGSLEPLFHCGIRNTVKRQLVKLL